MGQRVVAMTAMGVALCASAAWSQPFDVDWYTIDGGGGESSALTFQGVIEVVGTIGQPDASDEMTSPQGHSLVGGFWVATGPAAPCSDLDFNNNGVTPEDQDLIDYFTVLAGGPCSQPECDSIDFNGNRVFPEDQDVIDFLWVLAGGTC